MTQAKLFSYRDKAYELIARKKYYSALSVLLPMVKSTMQWDLQAQFNQILTSYTFLLKYISTQQNDPQRGAFLASLEQDLYTLTESVWSFLARQEIQSTTSSLEEAITRFKSISDTTTTTEKEKAQNEIFNALWKTFSLSDKNAKEISEIATAQGAELSTKYLISAALYLSLINIFDTKKFLLLTNLYQNSGNEYVETRVLLFIMLVVRQFPARCKSSTTVMEALNEIAKNDNFATDFRSLLIHLLQSADVDNMTKKVNDTLQRDFTRFSNELKKKGLNPSSAINYSEFEENPEWAELFEKSDINKAMAEFNDLQSSGNDMFWSHFSRLKTHPFFSETANWFRPYDPSNSAIESMSSAPEFHNFAKFIGKAPYICNSDRYSIAFTIGAMGIDQQKSILRNLTQSLGSEDFLKESLEQDISRGKLIAIAVHDIYRFHKLCHSAGWSFPDLFSETVDLMQIPVLETIAGDSENFMLSAELNMKGKRYELALPSFMKSLNADSNNLIAHQKIGFCYQNMQMFEKAIEHYNYYLLAHDNNTWCLRQISLCHKGLGNNEQALNFLQQAATLEPENERICMNIGNLLVQMERYDEALPHYFKAEYITNGNIRPCRAIAWCYFITRKFEQSRKYYNKVLCLSNDNPMDTDLLNFGHLALAEGNFDEAVGLYKKSLKACGCNFATFAKKLMADSKSLIQAGIPEGDIQLYLDAIALQMNPLE